MNRIDRLTAILIQLQSKKVVKAQEIANRFDISLRTVYRDVRALEEAGVPLGAEAGTGYFIMDGYHLPPVMFSQEEANALVLGAKLIEEQTDHSIKKHFNEAMYKIKSVLKNDEKEGLERLESQIRVERIPRNQSDDFPNNFLATIQNALINHKVLSFKYFSNYTGDFNDRHVEPIGLTYYGGNWHLLAYCRLRKAARDFRVDRLVKLSMLDEQFEIKYEVLDQFTQDLMRGTELSEVIINIERKIAVLISNQKFYQGFVSEVEKDGRVEMKFLVPGLEYFSRWLVSLGDSVEILEPESLKGIMVERARELADHYNS
ncbi:YafY family protein [Roseivirga sp. E12]|uniref:helix-turn-helix transcriptional regulator n=1 Tax=Roseivirga sp. E12 TaxID=2819237 RepID=UPI001F331BA7|nr:YafY family protein [Roseivirga sp. E12]